MSILSQAATQENTIWMLKMCDCVTVAIHKIDDLNRQIYCHNRYIIFRKFAFLYWFVHFQRKMYVLLRKTYKHNVTKQFISNIM